MGKKKLINKLRQEALKQLEKDIKDSIVKEFSEASKSEIKALKKQIFQEMKEEMFGEIKSPKSKKKGKKKKKKSKVAKTDKKVIVNDRTIAPGVNTRGSGIKKNEEFPGTFPYEPGKKIKLHGFEFDVDKMSLMVTGKKKAKKNPVVDNYKKSTKKSPLQQLDDAFSGKVLPEILKEAKEKEEKKNKKTDSEKRLDERKDTISKIRKGDKLDAMKHSGQINNLRTSNNPTPLPFPMPGAFPISNRSFSTSITPVPASNRNFVRTTQKITPAKREEVAFFIGKLKEGIEKLGKGEKNLNYRKKNDNVYQFSFNKSKVNKNDFSLKFQLDLNIVTYGAVINRFEFDIDGFKFDNSFVEILDMVKVLELVGMNIFHYVAEIGTFNGVSAPARKGLLQQKKRNKSELNKAQSLIKKKTIRSNTKIENIIGDARIVKVLKANDISNYGDLKKVEDFTTLKGVGKATADKIKGFITLKQK